MSEGEEVSTSTAPAAMSNAEAIAQLEILHQYLIKYNRTNEAAMFLLEEQSNGKAVPENLLYAERKRIKAINIKSAREVSNTPTPAITSKTPANLKQRTTR